MSIRDPPQRVSLHRFSGKVALVTGATHGIGLAIATELLREGASVVVSGLPQDEEDGKAAYAAAGFSPLLICGDLCSEEFCKSLVTKAVEKHGTLHFLVNNAFSFISKGITATRGDWERSLAVGPIAFATLMQQASVPMEKEGKGCAIVNISSISWWVAQPQRWTYNSAKAAVTQLTRCAALDLCVAMQHP